MPPLYKKFISWFEVGNDLFIIDKYYVEAYDDYFPCSYQTYPTAIDFELDRFLSLNEVIDHWKNKIEVRDHIKKRLYERYIKN